MPSFGVYPSLRGRVVVVTGGASGIGEAIVAAFMHQVSQVTFLAADDSAGITNQSLIVDSGLV
jgi:NAD(P)-dependent dehydrogenase (short-subunit alcohol dehydrogenase family)